MQNKKYEKIPDYNVEKHDTKKPIYEFKPDLSGHEWRQEGPYLICHSCEIKHATYIGIKKLLVGIDSKGNPILKKR